MTPMHLYLCYFENGVLAYERDFSTLASACKFIGVDKKTLKKYLNVIHKSGPSVFDDAGMIANNIPFPEKITPYVYPKNGKPGVFGHSKPRLHSIAPNDAPVPPTPIEKQVPRVVFTPNKLQKLVMRIFRIPV